MLELLTAFITAVLPPTAVENLRRTAPQDLTVETARDHLAAAVVASSIVGVDYGLLLSIAHHESRYVVNVVSHEVGGKVSCGVMTPEPIAHCDMTSLVDNYIVGAKHLRTWIDAAHGNMELALTGYAGGYHLIELCKSGSTTHGCYTHQVFNYRARLIRGEVRSTQTAKVLW